MRQFALALVTANLVLPEKSDLEIRSKTSLLLSRDIQAQGASAVVVSSLSNQIVLKECITFSCKYLV